MANNTLTLSVNKQITVQLPNRGSSGLRMVFTIDDISVVDVKRREIQSSDLDSLHLQPGDPVPAIFTITGLKKGKTIVHFAERKPGMNDGDDIPVKDYEVVVE